MATKIALMMTVIMMVLGHGMGQACTDRTIRKHHTYLRNKSACAKPHTSLVQLPVPKDFDYVEPSAVHLQQCTGLACSVYPERCLPVPGSVNKLSFMVNAKNRNDVTQHCVKVTVEEHTACECRCDTHQCPSNMVFNNETCECECDIEQEQACFTRSYKYGEPVMWSSDTCSCLCDHRQQCDSSSLWDSSQCLCVAV